MKRNEWKHQQQQQQHRDREKHSGHFFESHKATQPYEYARFSRLKHKRTDKTHAHTMWDSLNAPALLCYDRGKITSTTRMHAKENEQYQQWQWQYKQQRARNRKKKIIACKKTHTHFVISNWVNLKPMQCMRLVYVCALVKARWCFFFCLLMLLDLYLLLFFSSNHPCARIHHHSNSNNK